MGFRLRLILSLLLIEGAIGGTLYYLQNRALTEAAMEKIQDHYQNHFLFLDSLLKSHSQMGELTQPMIRLNMALTHLTQGVNDLAYVRIRSINERQAHHVLLESRASYFNSPFKEDAYLDLSKPYYCVTNQLYLGDKAYWLDIALNLKPTVKSLKSSDQGYLYTTLGLLVAVALVGAGLFRNYGRGIAELNHAVDAIEKGKLGYEIGDSQHLAELEPTARAFNHMSKRLALTVTEQEKLYKDLLKKDRRLELILNSTDEAILGLNSAKEVCVVNTAAIRLLEVDQASEIDVQHMLPSEARKGLEALYQSQQPFHLDDVCVLNAMDCFIPVEIRGSQIGLQEETFTILSLRNLSLEKRIRKEVEQQNSLKAALMDASLDGILLMDTRGNTLSYNLSMFNLCHRVLPQGTEISVLDLLGVDKRVNLNPIELLEEQSKINTGLHYLVMTDLKGGLIHTEYNIQAFDADGQLYYTLVVTDITDKVRSREKLEHAMEQADAANVAKSQFLAAMSHEIRTPLNGIQGSISLMENTPLNERQIELMKTASVSSDALMQLINEILDFAKIEAGKMELEESEISLQNLADEAAMIIASKTKEKQLLFNITVDPTIDRCVIADAGRLRQIWLNLLSNAVKFTEQGGISMSITRLSDTDVSSRLKLRVLIEDTGMGIAIDDQALLFNEFTQVNQTDSRKFGGSGLGLAISQKLAEMMNGYIVFASEKNNGSTFAVYLTLPQTSTLVSELEPDTVHEQSSSLSQQYRILLVEDSVTNQLIATRMLESLGQQVEIANNGLDALDAMKLRPFDLILMDLQMPEMNGYEATEQIRKMPQGDGVPIVAMTANVVTSDKERCFEIGMNDFLAKPAHLSELQSVLVRWLEKKGNDVVDIPQQSAEQEQMTVQKRIVQRKGSPESAEQPARQIVLGDNTQDLVAESIEDEVFSVAVLKQMENDIGTDRCIKMIGIVLDEITKRSEQLYCHFLNDETELVGRQAHALKSTSASFGLLQVSAIAKRIEHNCSAGETEALADDVMSLKQAIVSGADTLQEYQQSIGSV
ncbi:response regulator [Oceanospirillum sediminis]|uniref:histidine kinase n=1 Tax=Oceanospirillum sediminis TaxID=2760088 RepID=A0A839ISE5_9GAMM|nr:response regulator [Oceanospirillum sediminis]MBB1487357.1 response regulator [Oceanospirillum sediminis]